jgi:hypothetical protein
LISGGNVSVKPKITFKCENEDCEEYDKLYDISEVRIGGREESGPLKDIALSAVYFRHCRKCIGTGELHIEHGGRVYWSVEALGASLIDMAKEYKLLKRIVEGGIGTADDNARFQELTELLTDARCNHCGTAFIEDLC